MVAAGAKVRLSSVRRNSRFLTAAEIPLVAFPARAPRVLWDSSSEGMDFGIIIKNPSALPVTPQLQPPQAAPWEFFFSLWNVRAEPLEMFCCLFVFFLKYLGYLENTWLFPRVLWDGSWMEFGNSQMAWDPQEWELGAPTLGMGSSWNSGQ